MVLGQSRPRPRAAPGSLCIASAGRYRPIRGLPPAHIQVAGNDVLRDEGVAYARKLDAAGVEVTLLRYDGMIHDYCFFNHLSRIPAVRTALHQAASERSFVTKQANSDSVYGSQDKNGRSLK